MPDKALAGLRVLDVSHYLAGPYCSLLMADMGAEVIRVERPGGGDDRGIGPYFNGEGLFALAFSRGKKAITLDLRAEKGRQLFRRLVELSDIVVENFRPGVMAAMGFDYERLKAINERIILVSVSGFGQTGPYAQRPGFDPIAQAYSGMIELNGFPGGPPVKTAMSIADYAGGMYGALGAMFALQYAQRTGKGQHVDVSLTDSMVSFLESSVMEYVVLGNVLRRLGNQRPVSHPVDAYPAKDGYVYIIATPDKAWAALLELMHRDDLAADPRFATYSGRAHHGDIIEPLVAAWTAGFTVQELVGMLVEAGIPCGPVLSIDQVIVDPQVRSREMIVEVEHPVVGKLPVGGVVPKLSATPGEVGPPPLLGEHNAEIYGGLLGLTPDEIDDLRAAGVI